jgi:indolepyruvate ferredoxin oxidoreductase alpha subunit
MGISRVHVTDPTLEPAAFESLIKTCLDSGELELIIARRDCLLAAGAIRRYEKTNEQPH